MSSGLNPKIHLAIVLSLALAGTVFLATRSKIVIKDEVQTAQPIKASEASPQSSKMHLISEEAKNKISDLMTDKDLISNKPNLYKKIGEVFFNESAYDSAAVYFEKSAQISNTPSAWILAGDSYLQAYNMSLNPDEMEKLVDRTRSSYLKVLDLDPQNLHAKTNLAMTYVRSDSPMKAIGMLREVLELNPEYIPAIMSLGGLSMESGQYDKAEVRFNEVLRIDPSNINAKLGLAYTWIELGKTQEAKKLFVELLKRDIDPVMKDEVQKTLNNLK